MIEKTKEAPNITVGTLARQIVGRWGFVLWLAISGSSANSLPYGATVAAFFCALLWWQWRGDSVRATLRQAPQPFLIPILATLGISLIGLAVGLLADLTFRLFGVHLPVRPMLVVAVPLLPLTIACAVFLDWLVTSGRIKWVEFQEPEPVRPPECGECGITLRPGASQCHWCGWKIEGSLRLPQPQNRTVFTGLPIPK